MKWRPLRAGIACVLLGTSLAAQKETFAPANDVSLSISTERRSYTAGAHITLNYRVTNMSNTLLYVPREWEARCPASPHFWAWFENSSGQHFVGGYAGDCSPKPQTITDRMSEEAVLLKPGAHLDGTFLLDTGLFGGLKPGVYRIEAALSGWDEQKFTSEERSELAGMAGPFLRGQVLSSMRIT
jgi:hypothetical protein